MNLRVRWSWYKWGMAVKFSSHCVYQIRYQLVMCVKYRNQMLRRKAYQETLVAWLREIGKRYWYEIEEVGSDGDHVHIFVGAAGRWAPSRIGPVMNTEQMGTFLAQVSAAHPEDFIVVVLDGASSHVAKALVVLENIHLHRLPGYSPELNPQELLWDGLREKEFPNRVFSDMAGVVRTLETGLPRLAGDRDRVRSICAWPWIVSLNLKAH